MMDMPVPPRLDHGAIGNGRLLALISPTSAIEWLCLPRFDSPSIFARILDTGNGGTFRFLAGEEEMPGQLSYVANTNVLSTRFEKDGCIWEVVDFAPRIPEGLSVRVPIEMMRLVRPIKGQPQEAAIIAAPKPDMGIWEFRTMLRHYTFSRAMCWVAMQRGAILAHLLGHPLLAETWERQADRERKIILERGYNPKLGYFTQGFEGENADASILLFPTIGIVDPTDPRFVSTVDAYSRLLVVQLFQRLIKFANHLGLFSEDVDPATGMLLGNFPQAYTHVGLIHAAITISELLEARDGKVRAWC